jgi:hypothetical protein
VQRSCPYIGPPCGVEPQLLSEHLLVAERGGAVFCGMCVRVCKPNKNKNEQISQSPRALLAAEKNIELLCPPCDSRM